VEDTRIGHKTNYDRLIMDIWTDGTLTPEMALVEGAKILRKHLNPFVQFFELGTERVSAEASAAASVDEELVRKLDMPIAELDLSVRAGNCLESADIRTVGELVEKDEPELLAVRSFGKTSLREVKRKLDELGLNLGMQVPERHHEQEATVQDEGPEAV
jgi:DNA-directed RNA polymerase subunit alpha